MALSYRALGTTVSVVGIGTSGTLGGGALSILVVVAGVVITSHLVLIAFGLRDRLPPVRGWTVGVDVAIAVSLNLMASALIPDGQLFLDFGNPFSVYAASTVALWTGARGRAIGLGLVVFMAGPLQLAMAFLNHVTVIDWPKFVTRALWLVAAYVVARFLLCVLRRAAEFLALGAEEAGRAAKRAEMMASLHDVGLQALVGIAVRGSNPGSDPRAVAAEITAEARRRADLLEAALGAGDAEWGGLFAEITRLAAEIDVRGTTRAEFVPTGSQPVLPQESEHALVGAIAEALRNAERHGVAQLVTVDVDTVGPTVRAVVADDGIGFDETSIPADAFGISRSIRRRIERVGGQARLDTAPGEGTRWELVVPVGQAPDDDDARRTWRRWRRTEMPAVRHMVEDTLVRLGLVAVSYRALAILISIAGLAGSRIFGPLRPAPLVALMVAVLGVQVALVFGGLGGRLPAPRSWLVVVDVLVTVGLNLLAAGMVPTGTLFLDYRDAFGLYTQGTVALWAGIKGPRVGVPLLIAVAVPLQIAMARVNGIGIEAISWPKVASRVLWLLPAYFIGVVVVSVARHGGRALAAERRRSGLATERADALRALNVLVIETLEAVVLQLDAGSVSPASALLSVGAQAQARAAEIRGHLAQGELPPGGIYAKLASVVSESERRGVICPAFVHDGAAPPVDVERQAVVVDAVAAVLRDAERRRTVRSMTVYATVSRRRLRVVMRAELHRSVEHVTDHDRAPDLASRLAAIGGEATIVRSPDGVVIWELAVPITSWPTTGG